MRIAMLSGAKTMAGATLAVLISGCATQGYSKAELKSLVQELETELAARQQADCDHQFADVSANALGLIRVPPNVPLGLKKSGFCEIKADYNVKGDVSFIEVLSCSDEAFRYPTLKSVSQWGFTPQNPQNTLSACKLKSKVTFILRDKNGVRLPM